MSCSNTTTSGPLVCFSIGIPTLVRALKQSLASQLKFLRTRALGNTELRWDYPQQPSPLWPDNPGLRISQFCFTSGFG